MSTRVDECKPWPAPRTTVWTAPDGQGLTLIYLRAQLEQLQDTFMIKVGVIRWTKSSS